MEFRIAVDPLNGFIHCVLDGNLDLGIASQALRQASRLAREQGCGVLYDVRRVSVRGSKGDLYKFAHAAGGEDIKHGRTAIVCHEEKDKERWQFFVLVAQNAGVEVRLFDSGPDAAEWLAGGRKP